MGRLRSKAFVQHFNSLLSLGKPCRTVNVRYYTVSKEISDNRFPQISMTTFWVYILHGYGWTRSLKQNAIISSDSPPLSQMTSLLQITYNHVSMILNYLPFP